MSGPTTTERDQAVAQLEDTITGAVVGMRKLRDECTERFGYIDPFRITRDTAAVLNAEFHPEHISLMLSSALHRLAQMPDFVPSSFNGIEDLDFVSDEDFDQEGEV